MEKIDTHNLIVDFGKYKGERWTRLPISYLKWLMNQEGRRAEMALAELKRRGTNLNIQIEITPHALDRASLRCRHIWHETRENSNEGIYSWLHRVALKALKSGGGNEEVRHQGMKFIFKTNEHYPTLVTVMPIE